MSSTSADEPQSPHSAQPRLGYLLKQVQTRFGERVRAALAPLRIDTREWSVLVSLDDHRPLSQTELGERAGIDRTTLVVILDQLQDKDLIQRQPDRNDRRRNVIEITASGRALRTRAARQVDECERQFLAVLGAPAGRQLKSALQAVIASPR